MREKEFDRIKGALYGVAIGDALGAPVEFLSAEDIQQEYGRLTEMVPSTTWGNRPAGSTTDDTAMTLAVAEGILECPHDPVPAIGKRFLEWYDTNPRDIGYNTKRILGIASRWADEYGYLPKAEWRAITQKYCQSDGNGALMRTVYPALYYNSLVDVRDHAKDIAEMTHWSEESTERCKAYCQLIYLAITGKFRPETITRFAGEQEPLPPTGYVVDTYANAIQALQETDSFEEALINAVNRGGDTDTIGAVAGGLAGAMYGYNQIPTRWVYALSDELREKLDIYARLAWLNKGGE